MKKTLVALAALAVVSAASAQSTVTIYGLLDMGVASATTQATTGVETKTTAVQQGALANSRLGFKGTEDLGGGLKANFVAEFSLQPDSTATAFANRQSTIGLSGGFGAVTIGSTYTPYYLVQSAVDLVGNVNATPGYVVSNHYGDGGRARNAITYTTPTFSGFTASAQVSAGNEDAESTAGGVKNKSFGLNGIYAAGPLVAAAAYNNVTNAANIAAPNPVAILPVLAGAYTFTPGAGKDLKVWAVGALYDFGVAKASLAYSKLTAEQAVGDDVTSAGYNLSVAVPLGATTLVGNVGRANLQGPGLDGNIIGYQLGANYALSKRTTAYALLGRDVTQEAALGGTGEQTRFSTTVGVRHSF